MRTARRWALQRADVLVGAGFALAWAVEALVRDGGQPARLALDLPGAVFLLVLVLRRRRPLLTTAVFSLGAAASSVFGWWLGVPAGSVLVPILALLVAVYSLGAHGSRRALVAGGALAMLPVLAADLTSPQSVPNSLAAGLAFFAVFVVGLPLLAGRLVRGRARLVARLREQERLLIAQRAAATDAALAEERIQLTGRLDEELLSGMERLAEDVRAASGPGAADPPSAVRRIEERARAMLARTRGVVVSLAASAEAGEYGGELVPPAPPATAGQRSQPGHAGALPWTALAAAAIAVGLMIEVRDLPARVPVPVALLACLLLSAPLALAWRRPLVVTVATWTAAVVFSAVVVPLDGRFTAIGLTFLLPFFVAAFSGRAGAGIGLAICVVGQALVFSLPALPGELPLLLLSWIGGLVLAERGRLVARLRETTAALAAGRAAALRAAVLEERARVARDLHDSTGHRLTVLALHAAAARRMWDTDRPRARAALTTIERVAGEALRELRQGFVAAAEPEPVTLPAVAQLVEQARAAGLSVELTLDGATAQLAPSAGSTVYRVVQEALTNALRHAPGAPVRASVRCAGDLVTVEVVNGAGNGPILPPDGAHRGHGLVGMRQRVEACGGRLHWGARPEGGFAVRAEFPLAAVPA